MISTKDSLKTIFRYLLPYKRMLAVVILVLLCDVGGSLLVPTITANMINAAVSGGSLDEIIKDGIIMLAIAIISGGLTLLGCWLCARLSANFGRDIRKDLYDKSLTLSGTDFEKFGTASMITRTLNDINVIQQAFIDFVQMVLPVPIMCVLGIAFSFAISKKMGFLVLGATAFVMIAALFIMRKATPIFEKLQSLLDRMNVVLRENLTGVRVIRAFNKEKHEIKRTRKTFEDYAMTSISANYLFVGLDALTTVLINFCIVAILYLGAGEVGAGNMQIGDISAVTEYAIWILFYVMMAQIIIMLIPRALTCTRRVGTVLQLEPEILDGRGNGEAPALIRSASGNGAASGNCAVSAKGESSPNRESSPAIEIPGIENPVTSAAGDIIRFENVSFSFADADEKTLAGIDFTCKRGQTTAIIGGTGSGKSTIAKLILRFHDVTEGRVSLCGRDIRELAQSELRSHISYIPQKAWLFSGTIAENLRYGQRDASDAELIHALKTAQSDFVFELPDGLESAVAQGGSNFSGGQKQRLSIARALVKKADLYIFDDSFSALDFQTDAALRHALKDEIQDAAILIIAQRVSTILHADQILVLDDGRIAGLGRHEELMQSCEIYRDIVNSQMKGGAQNV